jgi:hypothetical protein
MSYFDKLVGKLFSGKKPPGTADVHEVMKRSEAEQREYEAWKEGEEREQLIREIAQAYYYKKTNIISDIEVHLLNTPYANGFAISYHQDISPRSFRHLSDYFRDQVLEMGYRLVNSDRRIIDRGDYVETIEKFYLKPPLSAADLSKEVIQVNQLFGNIAIEHVLIDNRPSYLKVLASIYSDRQYQEAQSYDDFITALFHQ